MVSDVGFEPTPTFVDQNSDSAYTINSKPHSNTKQYFTVLQVKPIDSVNMFPMKFQVDSGGT